MPALKIFVRAFGIGQDSFVGIAVAAENKAARNRRKSSNCYTDAAQWEADAIRSGFQHTFAPGVGTTSKWVRK